MRTFTCDPKAEVTGANLLGFINNLSSDRIVPVLEKHGLSKIEPDKWYQLGKWLDVLNELTQEGGAMLDFVAVGMGIADNTPLPPEYDDVPFKDILAGLDPSYQMFHRGADVGHIVVEEVNSKHYRVILKGVVYPDDLEYGVAYGFAKRFLPKGTHFMIHYDEEVTRQDYGGTETVIHIKWE